MMRRKKMMRMKILPTMAPLPTKVKKVKGQK
jgi:hypothetical protein